MLRYNGSTPLGGIIMQSGCLCLNVDNMATSPEALAVQGSTPIFIYHGTADTIIPNNLSYASYAYLRDTVYANHMENFSYQTEEGMFHTISTKEFKKVKAWLAK
jgi:predicted esterase